MTYAQIRAASRAKEAQLLRRVLKRHNWNITQAARELEIGRTGLNRALERHPELQAETRAKGPRRGRGCL